ncbi:MAG: hypothetical protein CSA54_05210 [Gammaproteobacteria bacterium]|nr:MAG: hypothetical protein CSA54_05210 [Gammaproteobacteria bacterium]
MKSPYYGIPLVAALVAGQAAGATPSLRIIGGQDASIDQYPFMAGLVMRGDEKKEVFCGAAVLDSNWVVTAAHCVQGDLAEDFEVFTGVDDLGSSNGQRIAVSRIIVHSNYDESSTENDIALLQLASSTDAVAIRAATPADAGFFATGQAVSVAGWGNTSTTSEVFPMLLREVDLQVTDFGSCSDAYDGLADSQICASVPGGGKDSCQGDSGGPLIARTPEGPILVGIVSFGQKCGAATHPGVYTMVSAFGDFLSSRGDVETPGGGDDGESGTGGAGEGMFENWIPDEFNHVEAGGVLAHEYSTFMPVLTGEQGEAWVGFYNGNQHGVTISNLHVRSSQGVMVVDDQCSTGELDAEGSCEVKLTWTPEAPGDLQAALVADVHDGASSHAIELPLQGVAVQSIETGDYLKGEYYSSEPEAWVLDNAGSPDGEMMLSHDLEDGETISLFVDTNPSGAIEADADATLPIEDDDLACDGFVFGDVECDDSEYTDIAVTLGFQYHAPDTRVKLYADGVLVAEMPARAGWHSEQVELIDYSLLRLEFEAVGSNNGQRKVYFGGLMMSETPPVSSGSMDPEDSDSVPLKGQLGR